MSGRRGTGELESEVLAILWATDDALTPRQVLDNLGRDIAYTTAMTILSRLWQKGLVGREKRGRAFAYRPTVTEAELAAERMQATLARTSDREGALARFVGGLSKGDERALRQLLEEMDAE